MSITITLPILFLILGGLTFWLLVESKLSYIFKSLAIVLFCAFSISLYSSFPTFLGWGARAEDMPEIVRIHSVVIKEPNPSLNNKGGIYLLLDSVKSKYDNKFLNMIGFKSQKQEPRLFGVPYSRLLHEELEKSVIPRTKNGQIVTGKLKKSSGGKGGQGKGKGKDNGDKSGKGGSESLEQEFKFYNLKPGEIQQKDVEEEK